MSSKETRTEIVETSIGPRNFRHGAEMENFYRFVHDSNIREEAKKALEYVLRLAKPSRKKKRKKKITH